MHCQTSAGRSVAVHLGSDGRWLCPRPKPDVGPVVQVDGGVPAQQLARLTKCVGAVSTLDTPTVCVASGAEIVSGSGGWRTTRRADKNTHTWHRCSWSTAAFAASARCHGLQAPRVVAGRRRPVRGCAAGGGVRHGQVRPGAAVLRPAGRSDPAPPPRSMSGTSPRLHKRRSGTAGRAG